MSKMLGATTGSRAAISLIADPYTPRITSENKKKLRESVVAQEHIMCKMNRLAQTVMTNCISVVTHAFVPARAKDHSCKHSGHVFREELWQGGWPMCEECGEIIYSLREARKKDFAQACSTNVHIRSTYWSDKDKPE